MNTQEFDLNIIPDSAPVVVHVDQYDHGIGRLVASLYDDETPYAPEGASVYVQGTKPDGKFFVRSTGVSISGNVVTADLAEVMTQVAGRTRMQFVVTEPSGRTGTFVFWLDVQLSALPPDSEMSESDISMVEEAIEQMQDLASDAAESAQEAAGFAQNSSDSAEDSEAWAVGTRNGEAVTPGDPTYHNNSKWYAEHGGGAGGGHTIVNSEGQDMPQRNALQFKGMNVTDDALNDMTIVEGGSGGSTIEVTTSESSLIGENVTVTDGTNSWTAQFDNSGKAVFSGITSTGTLTISATDGSETAQYVLTAPYFGKYAVTLAFWSATINVSTSTTQLNGKTVYAKKNGVVMGSGVFSNGSASITVPEAGSYTLEVTLSWKTYQSSPINVTAETTYSATLNGFIAPISLSTPTSEFYGQDISVTCDGTAVPGTSFDDSGAASFTALQAGTYVFIVMYNGEPYTATVIVTSETSYSAVINMFTATINVTTPSSSLYGQTITIKKDGAQVGTSQFDNTGAASITVHDTGSYVFEATYDGYTFASDPVNVSAETTYSATITAFTATLNISTSSPALYEQTITIKKGTTTVGTTTFSASGTASFNVHETGEYTLECGGYSSSVTVSAETTYSVTISAGLSLSAWITAGSTTEYPLNPASYANFAALETDEAAVMQLMYVHNAVDYLATATAGDTLMSQVINSNVCAKWINICDYAFDTLSANADIAAAMATADKYGYGDWIKLSDNPETWGPKGNVPIMTANNAPYGTVKYSSEYGSPNYAYSAFNGFDSAAGWCPATNAQYQTTYIGYSFAYPIIPKAAKCCIGTDETGVLDYNIEYRGSNDGFSTYDTLGTQTVSARGTIYETSLSASKAYKEVRMYLVSGTSGISIGHGWKLQFYGRELKPLVPIMTADDKPKGEAICSTYYTGYPPYKAFDGTNVNPWVSVSDTSPQWVGYEFEQANKVCMFGLIGAAYDNSHTEQSPKNIKIESSDTADFASKDTNFTGVAQKASGTSATMQYFTVTEGVKKCWRLYCEDTYTSGASNKSVSQLQFYGFDYSEKQFAPGATFKWIYNHGVELSPVQSATIGSGAVATKEIDQLYTYVSTTASSLSVLLSEQTLPSERYSYLCGKLGNKAYNSAYIVVYDNIPSSFAYSSAYKELLNNSGYADSLTAMLDISAITGTKYVGLYVGHSSSGTAQYGTLTELWLE